MYLLGTTAGDVYHNRLKTREYTLLEEGAKVWLSGEITDKEPRKDGVAVYLKNATVESIKGSIKQQQKFRILVYLNDENFCQIGDKVKIQGKIRQLQEKRNQGMFHQILYYKTKNIQYLCNGSEIILEVKGKRNIKEVIYQLRMKCYNRLFQIFPKDTAAVAGGILLGIKMDMEEEVKNLYQQAGIFHLISISGLHISCLGLALYHLLRKYTGSYGVSGGVTTVLLLGYCLLCGNSVSAQRSVIMAILLMGSWYLGRTYDMLTAMAVSAILILTSSPYQMYQAGFQLSFGAVLGISMVSPELVAAFGQEKKWKQAVAANLGIQLTTLPVILYYYYELPLYSLLLNLILVPGMSLLLTSCAVALLSSGISLTLGKFFAGVAVMGFQVYEGAANVTLQLPCARILLGQPSIVGIVCYYGVLIVGVAAIRYGNKKKAEILQEEKGAYTTYGKEDTYNKRVLLAMVLSVMFLCIHRQPELRITMLDVGQGDGLVIQSKKKVYLVDGGSTDISEVGKYRMLPYLKSQGIKRIDGIFISHMDSDHISGIKELLEYADKGEVYITQMFLPEIENPKEDYQEVEQLIQQKNIPITYLYRGMCLKEKKMQLQILQPKIGEAYQENNTYSMVFRLQYDNFSMLFTGDVEGVGEEELLENGVLSKVTVLKVPHHGSKYTSREELLEKLSPQMAWISCGKNNSYGHPHEELLQRLRYRTDKIYVTMDFGQVTVESNGTDVVTYKYCD